MQFTRAVFSAGIFAALDVNLGVEASAFSPIRSDRSDRLRQPLLTSEVNLSGSEAGKVANPFLNMPPCPNPFERASPDTVMLKAPTDLDEAGSPRFRGMTNDVSDGDPPAMPPRLECKSSARPTNTEAPGPDVEAARFETERAPRPSNAIEKFDQLFSGTVAPHQFRGKNLETFATYSGDIPDLSDSTC